MTHFRTPLRSAYPLVRDLMARIEASPLSIAEITRRGNVSHMQLLRWRAGTAMPKHDTLDDLLNVLGAEPRVVDKE